MAEDEDDGQQLQVVELHEAPMNIEPEMVIESVSYFYLPLVLGKWLPPPTKRCWKESSWTRQQATNRKRKHDSGTDANTEHAEFTRKFIWFKSALSFIQDLAALQRQLVADRGQLADNNQAPPGEDFGDPMDEDAA